VKKIFQLFCIIILLISCLSCEKKEVPTVKTVKAIFNDNEISIEATGKIVSYGGADVLSYGICMNQSNNPTIADTKVEYNGVGVSSFTGKFSDLEINATYYVRAYAVNSEGTGYGEVLEIKTSIKALVTTKEASAVGLDSATLNGSVNPNNLLSEVWIEYGETTSYGSKVIIANFNGSAEIPVKVKLTSLAAGKVYYFVVKVKNELGEISGSQMSFETYGLKDIDGNLYHTVVINGRVWTKENLKTTHFNDGTSILNKTANADWSAVTGTAEPAYCYYDNNEANKNVFGVLYNWYAASNQNIAPVGWHVPTADELEELIFYLGGQYVAGGKMKTTGTSIWESPNTDATNSSGFSAIPAGVRGDRLDNQLGAFGDLYTDAAFWSCSEYNSSGRFMFVSYNTAFVQTRMLVSKSYGHSLRLIKDQ